MFEAGDKPKATKNRKASAPKFWGALNPSSPRIHIGIAPLIRKRHSQISHDIIIENYICGLGCIKSAVQELYPCQK